MFLNSSDVKKTTQYMEGLNHIGTDVPWTESDIIQVWAEYTADNKEWMQKLGGKISLAFIGGENPEIPGSESIELWKYAGLGTRMMSFMHDQVNKRGIKVRHNTVAKKLLTNLKNHLLVINQ